MKSDKPLWKVELSDCALVLGTNALESLGFQITHPDGGVVEPIMVGTEAEVREMEYSGTHDTGQVRVSEGTSVPLGMLIPHSNLSESQCDFAEQLLEEKPIGGLSIKNWSRVPLTIEPIVSVVVQDEPIWEEQAVQVARISQCSEDDIRLS